MSAFRSQRRRLKRLQAKASEASERDKAWFAANRTREYRIRPATRAEIRHAEAMRGRPFRLEPGFGLFTIVRSFPPAGRTRLLCTYREAAVATADDTQLRRDF